MQNESIQIRREKLTSLQGMDLAEIILEDHKPLKELIGVMKDSEQPLEIRKSAMLEFIPLLIAHAKPEEQVLYTFLKQEEDLREEGFEGDVEHSLADQLAEECKRTTDEDLLGARIKVLAELVEHHIEEEEKDLLPDFKKHAELAKRRELGNKFLTLKVDYLAAGDDNIVPDPKVSDRELHH